MGTPTPNADVGPDAGEDARAAYQAAVALACAEASTAWAKFTAFIYAHTVLLLTVGIALGANASRYRLLATCVALLGLVLCGAWYFLNRLAFAWFAYWLKAARAAEAALSPSHRTLEQGAALSAGKRVSIMFLGGASEPFELPKGPRTGALSILVIGAFLLVYLAVLAQLWGPV